MEELFLCTLFSYNKLNIVNKKYINISVLLAELGHSRIVAVTDGVDQFICKVFTRDIEDLGFRVILKNKMGNRVHKVSLAETDTCIEIQRVIDLARRFRYGKRGSVGKFIISAHDKRIEGVLRIQMRFFHCLCKRSILIINDRIILFRRNVVDIQRETCDLGYGYLDGQGVFLIKYINSHGSGRNDESNALIIYALYLERFKPRTEGDIGETVIVLDLIKDFRPIFLYKCIIIHMIVDSVLSN